MASREHEGASMDMTPMIDVVFQLIIFFIVTFKLEQQSNTDIRLEMARHGPAIEKQDPRTIELEIDQKGRVSIHNVPIRLTMLQDLMRSRYRRFGEFPVFIRADYRTLHKDVKTVMDICTAAGLWRINFVAVKEKKGSG